MRRVCAGGGGGDLERLCAAARALRRRCCAVVRTSGRRCPRGQVGSGVGTGPQAARGLAQPRCVWASRERARPLALSSRAVRERAKPLSRCGPGPGRRTLWRSPASFSHLILFHHLCYGPPTPAVPPLRCLPRLFPSTSGFQPLFPRELASLTLLLVGT